MGVGQLVPYGVSFAAAVGVALSGFAGKRVTMRQRRALALVAWGALTATIILRWFETGHPPVFGTFENTLAATWALLAVLVWSWSGGTPLTETHAALLSAWLPVTLAYGLFFNTEGLPLTISERSLWVDVHVVFAWGAYAILLSGAMAAVARLLERDPVRTSLLDARMIRSVGVGFALFSGVIVVGSIYTNELFAVWFKWEIVEVLSVAAWLGYGLAAHAWLLWGWRGRRIAWCLLAVLPLLLGAFWAWSIYSGTYHYFDIVPMKAF